MAPAQPAQPTPNTNEIVSTIALADCNLYLAAERLARQYRPPNTDTNPDITPAALLSILSDDPEATSSLIRLMRTRTLLDAYTNMRTLSLIITASLTNYEPKDQIKVFQAFSTLFAQLAAERPQFGGTNNINLTNTQVNMFDRLLAVLPPDVRQAVQHLATPQDIEPTDATTDTDTDTELISRRRLRLAQSTAQSAEAP